MGKWSNYELVGLIILKGLHYLVYFKLPLLFIIISRRITKIKTFVTIEHFWISTWSNKNQLGTRMVWLKHLLIQLFNCASTDSVYSPSSQTFRQSCTFWLEFMYRFHMNNTINTRTFWVRKTSHKQPPHIISTTIILTK